MEAGKKKFPPYPPSLGGKKKGEEGALPRMTRNLKCLRNGRATEGKKEECAFFFEEKGGKRKGKPFLSSFHEEKKKDAQKKAFRQTKLNKVNPPGTKKRARILREEKKSGPTNQRDIAHSKTKGKSPLVWRQPNTEGERGGFAWESTRHYDDGEKGPARQMAEKEEKRKGEGGPLAHRFREGGEQKGADGINL